MKTMAHGPPSKDIWIQRGRNTPPPSAKHWKRREIMPRHRKQLKTKGAMTRHRIQFIDKRYGKHASPSKTKRKTHLILSRTADTEHWKKEKLIGNPLGNGSETFRLFEKSDRGETEVSSIIRGKKSTHTVYPVYPVFVFSNTQRAKSSGKAYRACEKSWRAKTWV